MILRKKKIFALAASGFGGLLLIIVFTWYVAQPWIEFSLIDSWFKGSNEVVLSAIKLSSDYVDTEALLTNAVVIRNINDAIKRKSGVAAPYGYLGDASIRLNGKWCSQVVFYVLPNDRHVVIGIPTEAGRLGSEYRFAELTLDLEIANELCQPILAIDKKRMEKR